ncbi:unnamed protein product, partial [Rotaria sp. Silwood2]
MQAPQFCLTTSRSYLFIFIYRVYFINESTSLQDNDYLLNVVQNTTNFVLDTESAYKSNIPALIQIYFLHSSHLESPLLLVEIQYLLDHSSTLFSKFKKLFHLIFNPKSDLHSWGPLTNELRRFFSCSLFTFPIIAITHNLQGQLKSWFNKWIESYYSSSTTAASTTTDDIVIINAASYDPTFLLPTRLMNERKMYSHESSSLQGG